MAQSYRPAPGKLALVTLYEAGGGGDVELAFQAYSTSGMEDPLEFTTASCRSFREFDESGLKKGILSFVGIWDQNRNPFSEAPTLKLGQTVQKVNVYIRKHNAATGDDEIKAQTLDALVVKWDVDSVADGVTTFRISLLATWKFHDFGGLA